MSRGIAQRPKRIRVLPGTRTGRRGVALAALSVAGTLLWSVLPGGAALGFVLGGAGGAFALEAIVRRGERSLLAYLAVLPLAFVVLFVAAELLIGHD